MVLLLLYCKLNRKTSSEKNTEIGVRATAEAFNFPCDLKNSSRRWYSVSYIKTDDMTFPVLADSISPI